MMRKPFFLIPVASAAALLTTPGWAGTGVQIGASGKTFASAAVQCDVDPATSTVRPMVLAGLNSPKGSTTGSVSLDGGLIATVTTATPAAKVWLVTGSHNVVVAIGRKVADSYPFTVGPYQCSLPDTSGNWLSPDGTLEYAASGKSYATVTPGCALNGATGRVQPYVHLFDNGTYLLNVSVNGVPLTQLSVSKTHAPVFLAAGVNVISAANGTLSTDYYVRDGGSGSCTLTP